MLGIDDLEIKKGELLTVIGPVGSGKTTFLASILRETQIKGKLGVAASSIAYVE